MGIDYVNAKDLKDVNYNLKLLIQKFNHEHSNLVKDINKISKNSNKMELDIKFLKNGFVQFTANAKANKRMLGIILGIIGAVGTLVSIGALLG